MTLKEFLENIQLAIANVENWEELDVFISSDDERNTYCTE